jgi:hypothetical protein
MGRLSTWDRKRWLVTPANGEPFTIDTDSGVTWALRALIATGPEGLRPTDGASGRFAHLIGKLRDLGLSIDDLPTEEGERPGFRLDGKAEPA